MRLKRGFLGGGAPIGCSWHAADSQTHPKPPLADRAELICEKWQSRAVIYAPTWPANGIVEEGANCFNPPPHPLGVVIPEAGIRTDRTELPSMILPVHTHMYVQYSTCVQYNTYVRMYMHT